MEFLFRYTELPFLLHILQTRTISLISPKYWEDKNDSGNIDEYQKRKRIKTVLILSLTKERETFHHWKVFGNGKSGVSISFFKNKLLKWAEINNLIAREMIYLKNNDFRKIIKSDDDDLPFIKRWAYKDEEEFRIIFEDKKKECFSKDFEIDLSLIRKIRISPWLPKKISESVVKTISNIDGCKNLEVNRTTVVDNLFRDEE